MDKYNISILLQVYFFIIVMYNMRDVKNKSKCFCLNSKSKYLEYY